MSIFILIIMIYERFPYKEEVTGSNPVAPTGVFQKSYLKTDVSPYFPPTFSIK